MNSKVKIIEIEHFNFQILLCSTEMTTGPNSFIFNKIKDTTENQKYNIETVWPTSAF